MCGQNRLKAFSKGFLWQESACKSVDLFGCSDNSKLTGKLRNLGRNASYSVLERKIAKKRKISKCRAKAAGFISCFHFFYKKKNCFSLFFFFHINPSRASPSGWEDRLTHFLLFTSFPEKIYIFFLKSLSRGGKCNF